MDCSESLPLPSSRSRGSFSQILRYGTWLLLLGALVALYGPTVQRLATGLWQTDQNAHGPVVLVVALLFLAFKLRALLIAPAGLQLSGQASGLFAVLLGLALLVVGRSQTVYVLEVGSLVPLLVGLTAYTLGWQLVRRLWFSFFFFLFMVPLPGSITDAITQPMKIAVSYGVEHLLYACGYPIARSGVVLSIGPYQLLVADACAGLNSLFTLEALGLLYMNVVRHSSAIRNLVLAICIIPISFFANMVRVLVLSLVTYHWGDAAGQGFLHEFSGMVLFLSALLAVIGVDSLIRWCVVPRRKEASHGAV
ncbi:MAG: exosortase B [Gammaproteobacteria bacterium]|nr:exosortase B [Gammaproteobacteria bacterium]